MDNDRDLQGTELTSDLVEQLKAGNEPAFEVFLSRYEKRIFAYLATVVRSREEAEDLTQETFLRVYKNRSAIDSARNVKSWLYTIATNAAYDWFRKKKHIPELFVIDDDEAGFETADDNDTYKNIENADAVERALGRLKPEYRTCILLYYYEQFSYEEIASQLALPVNTVKTHLRRAKQQLALEIKKDSSYAA